MPAIILRLAGGGSLRSIVNKQLQKKIVISDIQKTEWSNQLADAIAYMHGLRLIHRDLKPANVLVGDQNEIKLADFGLCCKKYLKEFGFKGTLKFAAPEYAQYAVDSSKRQRRSKTIG